MSHQHIEALGISLSVLAVTDGIESLAYRTHLGRFRRAIRNLSLDAETSATATPTPEPSVVEEAPEPEARQAEDTFEVDPVEAVSELDTRDMTVEQLHEQHGQTLRSQIRAGDIPQDKLADLKTLEEGRSPTRKSILDALSELLLPPKADTLLEARVEVAEVPADLNELPEVTEPVNFPEPAPEVSESAPETSEPVYQTKDMTAAQAKSAIQAGILDEEEIQQVLADDTRATVRKVAEGELLRLRYGGELGWPLLQHKAVGKSEGTLYAEAQACEDVEVIKSALELESGFPSDFSRKSVIKLLTERLTELTA
jgi:hypothetical protein